MQDSDSPTPSLRKGLTMQPTRSVCAFLLGALFVLPGLPALAGEAKGAPDWALAMKKVHARFKGTPGTLAQFGDSITVTMAYWAPLANPPKDLPPEMARALEVVKKRMKPECWAKWKGPGYGSNGSMTIRWADQNVAKWLEKLNPEVALIMFGTNDLGEVPLREYEEKTRAVVRRCLDNGTVVILSTIPPRSGRLEQARSYAEAVRRIAREEKVPLIDYFAEVLKRRPDDWDGALPKFKDAKGVYEVPTLISRDGVHPSNPSKDRDYSEESLRSNGYALRNYLSLLAYADVVRRVLGPAPAPVKP
jgi:lysophospholipase L1-like esterase